MDTEEYEKTFGEQAWNERYESRSHLWSGNPNAALVTAVAHLSPGTALDAGAGEGADACWLAERGWRVTGLDLSSTAVERAAQHAAERGLDVAFQQLDLTREAPSGSYDLVSAFFLHFPQPQRETVFSHLAAAVAPGGTLLIVGHDPSDEDTTMARPHLAEMGWTAAELAAALGDGWVIDVAESQPRQATDQDGREVTIHDAVVRARRV
jgi:2-polyprenyl-3-methyl-5-hydroxy-6-metoxy-1,4-benzoquinol methylase